LNRFLEFFEGSKDGKLSSSRLGLLLVVLVFSGDWIVHIVRNIEYSPDPAIAMLIAGLLGIKEWSKVKQK
jgi:hypothetical protein